MKGKSSLAPFPLKGQAQDTIVAKWALKAKVLVKCRKNPRHSLCQYSVKKI